MSDVFLEEKCGGTKMEERERREGNIKGKSKGKFWAVEFEDRTAEMGFGIYGI